MFENLHLKNIPIIIVNARITKRSFDRWQIFQALLAGIWKNNIGTTKFRNFKISKIIES